MQYKYMIMAFGLSFFGFSAGAQNNPKKLEQLAKDPDMETQRAKADVYILGKKIKPDSLPQSTRQPANRRETPKNKNCKKDTKKGS